MWTAGPVPMDLDTSWPTPIIGKIVRAFSKPGGQVVLLPWPTPGDTSPHMPAGDDRTVDNTPSAEPDGVLADALAAVEGLRRTGRVVRVTAGPAATGPASRPFWDDLVGDPGASRSTVSASPRSDIGDGVSDDLGTPQASTDLIITSLRPQHGGDHAGDLVALVAARLLRVGGILAVLTHCDWTSGELTDPTGAVVAAAQNADLLYLQHIVALHAPVHAGRFASDQLTGLDSPTAEDDIRARHRAAVRGLPTPHRRIHSDLLVFGQQHDYEPPRQAAAGTAMVATGVIR
ncbi:hypothetical protein [Saccharothrix sp. NRRL B-16348]|uniref:hypothetical protein n=1 Tax=Saccharothrix sp. NRRL B-16348 TaxID=1415542 RepID=UPI0012F8754A|nr:hypothetical protein [Saccharothrix sp. NRRL B-16348]